MKNVLTKIGQGFKWFFSKNGMKWFLTSFIWLFVILFVLDIVTKNIVMNTMVPGDTNLALHPIVHISYTVNHNAAFGLGSKSELANRIIYACIAIIASIVLAVIYIIKYKKLTPFQRAVMMMIIAGALGNTVDRLFYSASDYGVVDWIDFYWFWSYNFNIADSCVVVAAFMIIGNMIYGEVKEVKAKRQQEIQEINEQKENENKEENK